MMRDDRVATLWRHGRRREALYLCARAVVLGLLAGSALGACIALFRGLG